MTKGSLERAVVVTGASTGIGRAAVAKAVREGAHVFASVRKQADADGLTAEFGAAVTPLLFDVADESAVRAGAAQVAAALGQRKLFGLVNNAGIAVSGPLLHLGTEDLKRQFEINLFGVHNVTRAFADVLGVERARAGSAGRIVMISSMGGRVAFPFTGAYHASKFALEGYSTSLRRELMLYGIDVIVVGPGSVATPIWDKADDVDGLARFGGTAYGASTERVAKYMIKQGKAGIDASEVGDLIWSCLTTSKPKTRYSIMRGKFRNETLLRYLPPRVVDRLIGRQLGLSPLQ